MGEVFTELERRKILAILGTSRDLIKLTLAKIYTSDKNGENWLFSDLDGFLCFILDHNLKTRFFVMYDFDTYEKLFQFELYNDFSNAFQPLSDDFYCFEYAQSFIGFKFCDSKEANMFQLVVSKFNENFVNMLFESSSKTKKLLNKQENVHLYCEILKEKFSGGKKLDETYIEDGLEICKSRYFELMNNISYDRDKKEFIIGKIPEQLKSMFKDCGLKKSDFKNTQFALNIFKHFIQTIDAIDSNKKLVIDEKVFTNGIKNNFSGIIKNQDGESDNTAGNRSKMNTIISSNSQESRTTESTNSEIKKVVYFEKAEKSTSDMKLIEKVENISLIEETNSLEIQKIDLKIKESNIHDSEIHKISEDSNISNLTNNIPCQNLPNIPIVPNIPKIANIPNIPKVPQIPTVPKIPSVPIPIKKPLQSDISNQVTPLKEISKDEEINSVQLKPIKSESIEKPVSMFDEIKKVQLKKVEHRASTEKKTQMKITRQATNILQHSLAEAIKQRRIELTKHDVDSDENESDWSD